MRADLIDATVRTVARVQQVLAAWHSCERRLKATNSLVLVANLTDVKEQLAALVHPGFVTAAGVRRLPDLMRYLVAVDRRLQQMPAGAQRDGVRMEKVHEMQAEYAELLAALPAGPPCSGRGPGHPLDDRGAAGQLLRPRARHRLPGLRQAHPEGRSTPRGPEPASRRDDEFDRRA